VFKEKEIPHWFAGGMVALILNFSLMWLSGLLYYLYPSDWIDTVSGYLKYLGLASIIFAVIFVSTGDRYKTILEKIEQLDKSKKIKLGAVAIVYVLIVISLVLMTAYLSRSTHLGNL
jgi:hypothetical protein